MFEKPLNKNSATPLYRQLSARLAEQIQNGEYQLGDKLPSEREFSEQLNVSRITARQAIEALLESGLIYREQGRGTFVAEPRMRHLEGLSQRTTMPNAACGAPCCGGGAVLARRVRKGVCSSSAS